MKLLLRMELIFATKNLHKLREIQNLAGGKNKIIGLGDIGFNSELPEDFETLEKNSSQKAWYVFNKLHKDCFADDTGLEVDVLNGSPGVYSARYSRLEDDSFAKMEIDDGNISKLLFKLQSFTNRKARFRTVISLILSGKEYQFEGIVNGVILSEKWGKKGFGYDSVFLPDGYSKSFAQMSLQDKNKISHRSIALAKLIGFINDL